MSLGETLVILVVALVAFGPKKLPMLARHIALMLTKFNQLQAQITQFWHHQQAQLQLEENEKKAQHADNNYHQSETNTSELKDDFGSHQ